MISSPIAPHGLGTVPFQAALLGTHSLVPRKQRWAFGARTSCFPHRPRFVCIESAGFAPRDLEGGG